MTARLSSSVYGEALDDLPDSVFYQGQGQGVPDHRSVVNS
jgi:hypothetical protein